MNINSGLDRLRLVSNVLMLVLLAGNIFFSVQYVQNSQALDAEVAKNEAKATERIQMARFMKFFIDTVLNTKGTLSYDDRVKLENDIRQIHDDALTAQWTAFVNSKDNAVAQENVVKLMSMLSSRMI